MVRCWAAARHAMPDFRCDSGVLARYRLRLRFGVLRCDVTTTVTMPFSVYTCVHLFRAVV